MKYCLYISLIFLILSFPLHIKAEDTIKVLMLENPGAPLPAENVETVGNIAGKVLINGEIYEGDFMVVKDGKGLYVINNLPFEKYIEGVIASVIGKEWELEALKAQAVISRTYAITHKTFNTDKTYHLTSSVLHQLYKGDNIDPLITYAVRETENEVLTYGGDPIEALFHATCEGKTELPEEVWQKSYPYLKSVDCNSRNAPYENWQRKFTFHEIEKAFGISKIKNIAISSHTKTGRVKTLVFTIESDESGDSVMEVKAADLRKSLGYKEIPSTQFNLTVNEENIIFQGKGYGHGVGLSQWGALEMARQGKTYREILSHFFPGTIIQKRDDLNIGTSN